MAKRHTRNPADTPHGKRNGNGGDGHSVRKTKRDTRRAYQDNHTRCENCDHYGNEVIMYRKWYVFFCSHACLIEYGMRKGYKDTPTVVDEV